MNLLIFGLSLVFLVFFVWHLATTEDRTRRLTAALQIAALLAVALISLYWSTGEVRQARMFGTNIKPGLDLRGGTQFTIQLAGQPSANALDQAVEVIRKRIDKTGVAEPIIQPAGENRIIVQIPGIDEALKKDYRAQLERVARLEFRMVHPRNAQILQDIARGNPPPVGYEVLPHRHSDGQGGVTMSEIVVKKRPVFTGKHVRAAARSASQLGQPEVIVYFTAEGSRLFGAATKSIIDESALEGAEGRMAIVLDGLVYYSPGFRDNRPIYDDSCVISGGFTAREAEELASVLENPLETPVTIVDERGVDPSLGKASIDAGFRAGAIGLVLVIAFMIFYYRLAGVFAVAALLTNLVILLGLLAQFGFTLTLPGIAGIILTIGMAVDANVLIFERIREEQERGVEPRLAVAAGFNKAFSSIMDANVTTLIAAAMMFWQGTGAIKGFAVVLCLGILTSLFTALILTRTCFDWTLRGRGAVRPFSMVKLFAGSRMPFMGWRFGALALSAILFVTCLGAWVVKGDRAYGVDFVGGDLLTLGFKERIPDDRVRAALGDPTVTIQYQTSPGGDDQVLVIKTAFDQAEKAQEKIVAAFPEAGFHRLSLDKVQPVIGSEFKEKAAVALLLGMLGIFAYVMVRFEFSFAVGAIVALVHDVVITMGIFTLMGFEFSLPVVGAVLTVAGYSINDTIVVFDRIREMLKTDKKTPLMEVMNVALNATLSRTLLTSGTTLLAVVALFVFGGLVIHDFAFILLVGILVGTYSSIFIAAPIVLMFGDKTRQSVEQARPAAAEA